MCGKLILTVITVRSCGEKDGDTSMENIGLTAVSCNREGEERID